MLLKMAIVLKILGIDNGKCIKCVDCVQICPSDLFYKPPTIVGEKRSVSFVDPNNECISCGNCIEVCPVDAIIYEKED